MTPHNPRSHLSLATALENTGQTNLAKQEFEETIRLVEAAPTEFQTAKKSALLALERLP